MSLAPRLIALIDRVAEHPNALLLLDYDGTLVPIRSRPGLARLDAEHRATMGRLHGTYLKLAMMSGRSVRNLKERVALPDIGYGGVFGLEVTSPGWRYIHPHAKAMRPALAGLVSTLGELYKDLPGVLVEDKEAGLTLHYRNVPKKLHHEFSRRLEKARAMAPPQLEWNRGKAAWEVLPKTTWNKGKAALMLWRRLGRPFMLALGDDPFDEPMLLAAQKHGGAGIRVGEGPSKAAFRLKDPAEVHRFLRALADRAALSSLRRR
jgi:trehalose 6-phosphate phosphatase